MSIIEPSILSRVPTDVLRMALTLVPAGASADDAHQLRERVLGELRRRRHPAESVGIPAATRRMTTADVAAYLQQHIPNITAADAHAAANGMARTILADLWLSAREHYNRGQR